MAKSTSKDPLRQLVSTWVKKLKAAYEYKKPFSEDAKEASNFFDGQTNWMWENSYMRGEKGFNNSIAPPNFRVQVNAVFELVDIFGAVMYHRNPVRTVTVQHPPEIGPEAFGIDLRPEALPMMTPEQQQIVQVAVAAIQGQQQKETEARILEGYLNFTPVELDLKRQARKAVREALIKGMGTLWTELVTLDTSSDGTAPPVRMIGSFYDTVDNLLIDPDYDNMDDMQWCARKCVHSLIDVAREYGIPEEELRKHTEDHTSDINLPKEHKSGKRRDDGEKTNELVTYYKIWSKCGMGDRFKNAPKDTRGLFDAAGQYVYLVICEGVPYPLNLPPPVMDEQINEQTGIPDSIIARVAWPIPYYADPHGWPFTSIAWHWKPGYAWPVSHIRPAIGELRLINWALSYAATRLATSCETVVAVQKAADATIKEQLLSPSEGGFKLIELSELLGRRIEDVISVFQFPQVSKDLWDIIGALMEQFAKRTGLSELVYGYTRSMIRSASEAQIKQENVSIRPDNMSNELEDSMSLLARREALAARWLLEQDDVAAVLGPLGAIAWGQMISSKDIVSLTREFLFRVEAGSARKPNKATRVEQMQMSVQTLGPILSSLVGAGIVDPFNTLMKDWADSLDIDAAGYLVPPPAPPMPPDQPPPATPSEPPPADDAGAEGAAA